MGNYSKLIGAIAGNVVAIILVVLASKGLGTCDATQSCTVLGFTTAQVTGGVLAVLNSAFVYFFPANKPA